MKALLWKELRENAKWALLTMIAFGAAAAFGVVYNTQNNALYHNDGITVAKKTFLMATTFGAPAVALFLAFLQVLPELKTDRWAALLHRPVPATSIFWAKVLAGVLLYLAAVGLPYLAIVAWVAAPGSFATPFTPGMLQPSLVDLCAGLLYYFAALTIALQRGRSLFLYPLPLLAALHVSFFTVETKLAWVALEAIVFLLVALVLAAWGVMQSRDRFSPRPWITKAAFLAVTFYGLCGAGDLLLMVGGRFIPKPPSTYSRYETTKSGPPVRLVYENNKLKSVLLPDGKPSTDPKFQPNRINTELDYGNTLSTYIGDDHGWKPPVWTRPYRNSTTYVYADRTVVFPRTVSWFYLYEERCYLGFDPMTKEAISRLDNDGFRAPSAPLASFPKDGESSQADIVRIFGDGDRLRFAFLDRQEIVTVPLPAPGPIYGVAASWSYLGNKAVYIISVALRSGIALYNEHGALLTTLPYRHDVDRWGQLTVTTNKTLDRFQVQYEPSVWIDRKTKEGMPIYVDQVNLQGEPFESYTLEPLPKDTRGVAFTAWLQRRIQPPAYFWGETAYQKIGASVFGSTRLANADRGRWTTGWPTTLAGLIWSNCISLVLAATTLLWTRRTNFPPGRSWAWTAFVFALGLPGFLTFRLACDWPMRTACPSCAKRRPVQTPACPSCGGG